MSLNNINLNSIPVINSPKARQKTKVIGAPAVLAGAASFISSKAPKDAAQKVKLSKRFSKAGKAALLTAAVMALLTTSKQELQEIAEKIKNSFSNLKNNSNTNSNVPDTAETLNVSIAKDSKIPVDAIDSSVIQTDLPQEIEAADSLVEDLQTPMADMQADNQPVEINPALNSQENSKPQILQQTPQTPGQQPDTANSFVQNPSGLQNLIANFQKNTLNQNS